MEDRVRAGEREPIVWAVGLPFAVTAATLTLSAVFPHPFADDGHGHRHPFAFLPFVIVYGPPAALIARRLKTHRQGTWLYYTLAGAAAGFIGLCALALLSLWADSRQDIVATLANMTWSKAAHIAGLTAEMAWPGAIAGLAGGAVFGGFAKWADSAQPSGSRSGAA